jgi:hypothetical protein
MTRTHEASVVPCLGSPLIVVKGSSSDERVVAAPSVAVGRR